jgi:hypothetical protein
LEPVAGHNGFGDAVPGGRIQAASVKSKVPKEKAGAVGHFDVIVGAVQLNTLVDQAGRVSGPRS